MSKNINRKLIGCFVAAALVFSSTLSPIVANAEMLTGVSSVTRIGGVDRYETAALMAQKGWSGTSDNVVLSAGMNDNLVDALAAGPLAFKLKAPILLTEGQTLNAFAKIELQRLKPKKAYITSGLGVIKPSVIEELKALGITPVPLGGLDRYETSVKIAQELALQGANVTRVVLAGAWVTPADALSISSIAATQEMPILATSMNQLPATVKAYLDTIKANVTDSYVIGGTGVIADAVKGELPGKVSRYSGLDRYDTNVQVLKNFAKEYKNDKVYVANGISFVDAVAGVPLAAADRSAVVLVSQPIDSDTNEFVKLSMSTDDMVVLGGEGAVSAAGMSALTSVVTYDTDSATVGGADATHPLVLTDNAKITGDSVTLKNTTTNYSVYIKGNNVTLKNITVKGTVFVDPGETGSATLDGVTAGNIVILSGAPHSVIITNSSSGQITVSSDGNTNVVLTAVTTDGVSVQTYVVYETVNGVQVKTGTITITSGAGNDLGEMTITSDPGQETDVNLSGQFNQPITVEGQGETTITAAAGTVVSSITSDTDSLTLDGAGTFSSVVVESGSLTAATGTTLPSVTVNTTSSTETVTLAGTITNLTQTQGNTTLETGTTVTNMTTTNGGTVIVPPGSSVTNLTSTGTPPALGGGGPVNGQTTPIIPPVTPPPVIPPVTPPPGGGGGGVPPMTTLSITSLTANITTATNPNVSVASTGSYTFSLSSLADTDRFTGLQLASNGTSPSLVITSIQARGVDNWLSSSITAVPVNGTVGTSALLGALDSSSNGVSLANLRLIFGTGPVVLTGYLSQSGYNNSATVTVTINLGTSTTPITTISNEWMTITKSSTSVNTVTVEIKPGQESKTMGDLTDGSNFNFVNVVASMLVSNVNYTTSGLTATQLKDKISAQALGYIFADIPLSKLQGKTISFGTSPTFTVIFQ